MRFLLAVIAIILFSMGSNAACHKGRKGKGSCSQGSCSQGSCSQGNGSCGAGGCSTGNCNDDCPDEQCNYKWVKGKDQYQIHLYCCGKQIGTYSYHDARYYSFDGKRWKRETCPINKVPYKNELYK